MLVVGVILTAVGAISLIYGIVVFISLIAPVISAPNLAFLGNPELFWIIAGAIVAILGVILIIAGKKQTSKKLDGVNS
ncbi:MAG: hypothetical protein ACM3S4_00675 [Burkholderiales bacterium]